MLQRQPCLRRPGLAQLWLLGCALLIATHAAVGAVDFGDQLVTEAVDLAAAHAHDSVEQSQEMQDLLHWAIEHSDPAKLREDAEQVEQGQVVKDFIEQRKRVKELSDHLAAQPTEIDLIKASLAVLVDAHASEDAKLASLEELQVLVEPIDKANDLERLDGLAPLVELLAASPKLQAAAAVVLGTAASNNHKFQQQLMQAHPEVLEQLMQVASGDDEHAAIKGMYAVGQLVRITPLARDGFLASGGLVRVQKLLQSSRTHARLKRKAISLVTDLIESGGSGEEQKSRQELQLSGEQQSQLARTMLQLLAGSDDPDSTEKALLGLRSLLVAGGHAVRSTLMEDGAESVLREVLTEMELAYEHQGPEGASSQGGSDGDDLGHEGEPDAGMHHGEEHADAYQQYLMQLTAELLHYLTGSDHSEL